MKQALILTLLLGSFLFITPQVSANSGSNNNNNNHNFFQNAGNRFNDWWHRFHHDDHHNHGKGKGDGSDKCDGDNDADDTDCPVSAPEFSGLTAPVAFLAAAGAFVISKKRGLI